MIYFIFGLIIGSFLNVCIYRIPLGQSIVTPGSHCTACKKELKWWQLVPVVSYVLLKGKCAYCSTKISIRYPLVELFTGLMYWYLSVTYGYDYSLIVALIFFSILLVITLTDIDHQIIPNKVVFFGMACALILNLIYSFIPWLDASLGFFLGGGFMLLIAIVSNGGMGGGDIKLVAMMGLFLGWKKVFVAIFIASVIGAVFGLVFMMVTGKDRKTAIPFGPFLAIGGGLTFLWFYELVNWYFNLVL